jgi:unsaturated rhamnogalacturonyl hydrolase
LKEIAPKIKHYYGILAMIGGLKTAEVSGDDAYAQEIVRMLSRFPDEIDTGFTHFPSYRIGGIARAYALFKGYMTDERTVALIREYAEELMTAPRDRKGIVKNTVSLAREVV